MSRRFYLSLLGVVAWSATATDTVFSMLDAASLSTARVSFAKLPIAASALDWIALFCVGLFAIQCAWKREGSEQRSTRISRILAACCILPSAVALMVSLISIIVLKSRSREVKAATSKAAVGNWTAIFAAQMAIWILACLSQIALYCTPLWKTPNAESTASSDPESGPRDSVMSETRNSNQTPNLYMIEPALPASPLAIHPSPTSSARSSQSLRSWRDSLHHVVRPVTSRTKLINRSSLNRDSRSIYPEGRIIDNISTADGFETWDTSDVDPSVREAAKQSAREAALQSVKDAGLAPSRGTVLEPIPGSRPPSPARALDGPFPLISDGKESPALAPPPKMMHDHSRPPSPCVSEANIHPLFRTESPTPAPPMTSGTSIMASPLATQMIPCPARPYSRMRSNSSRANSPSSLMHSQSLQSLRASNSILRRSPSPPSRPITPPIPDFVLNNSPSPRGSSRHVDRY
ncbi:hypothetical protein K504DRAFT_501113 [Pleomassaria siparia CBS 279.74]|uniref:Uncharacterized protein n=1 Tax=Pleomassaria siparia CBS 279.74 TaxID=1314801 RepID=A0A6G1KFE2_9PLEO|nr:hypothetical protein K504DRAFT_501113 [Pleomassaria siparia CBS 279.74]